jgi:hypothetical protein
MLILHPTDNNYHRGAKPTHAKFQKLPPVDPDGINRWKPSNIRVINELSEIGETRTAIHRSEIFED